MCPIFAENNICIFICSASFISEPIVTSKKMDIELNVISYYLLCRVYVHVFINILMYRKLSLYVLEIRMDFFN